MLLQYTLLTSCQDKWKCSKEIEDYIIQSTPPPVLDAISMTHSKGDITVIHNQPPEKHVIYMRCFEPSEVTNG